MELAGLTDMGKNRKRNEDTFFCERKENGQILAVVIDGCGGHQAGDVCARIVKEEMHKWMESHDTENLGFCLKEAAVHANSVVMLEKEANPELSDMCCVMTAVIVDTPKKQIHMVHVGDSRLYAYLDGRLVKLSHDHSPVGELEEKGYLTEEEAMNHINRNRVRRAIGTKELDINTEYLECKTFPIAPGIGWLLCSDGLTDMITSAQIGEILCEQVSLEKQACNLVQAANEAGGKDNITVVLVQDTSLPDGTTEELFLSLGKSTGVCRKTTTEIEDEGVVLELVETTPLATPQPEITKKNRFRIGWIYAFAALVFLLCTVTVCLVVHQKMEQYQQQELYRQNQELLKSLYYNINNR